MKHGTDNVVINDGDRWKFDEKVASVFDDMLERSVPRYSDIIYLTCRIGSRFVKPETNIIDVGCSNGNDLERILFQFENDCTFYMLDNSKSMIDRCIERYRDYIDSGCVVVRETDVSDGINIENASLIVCVLTLQFTPIEKRHKILRSIYDSLNPGGAFIFVEKVLGGTSFVNDLLVDEYYWMKRKHGYTDYQIDSKRKSLEGVLVPVTAEWNQEMLFKTGFKEVECFWRYLNFCGWIAVK